jgi:4-hydroxy 2-oxovalerate aldolase
MNTTPILLDCTLRDGGYHNNWDFDSSLIQEYLNAVAAAGVDYVGLPEEQLRIY